MRFLGFLNRKKQIAPAPSPKSTVHPAINGQVVYCVKRAKIKELLGVATPQECREVDELLNRTSWQVNPSPFTDDDDEDYDEGEQDESVDDGSTKEEEEKYHRTIAIPQQKGRSISDLQVSTAHVDLAAQKLALPSHKSLSAKISEEHATRKPCLIDTTMKANALQVSVKISPPNQRGEDCATRKPCAVDTKASPVEDCVKKRRPARLTCIKDKAGALSSRNGLGTTSERTTAPHPSRIRGKKNASCVGSFPLPPLFHEKHYLPAPQARASEEVFSVAHPLPQPPPTMRTSNGCVLEHVDDKGHSRIARAVSCDPLVKPQLIVKENLSIAHTVSLDPPKQLTQKLKTLQASVGSFPLPNQGLQNTPPTTPRPQAHRTPQDTLPTTAGMQLHQTPQSSPPTTPGMQLHQTPQNTPPTTPRAQHQQTPQNTPPVTPHSHHHPPQVFINVTRNALSPPSSNRQSPRLSTLLYSHSPPHFPSQHVQFGHSPPCSPLPRLLCPRKWIKGDLLGQGTFGTVYQGLNEEDGSFFAVKVSSREDTSPEIRQEVDVLSKLVHPNIVRYLGSSVIDNRLCIFLELVRMGSLDSILRNFKRFDDHTIRSYTRQILLGLEYLHSKKTIHRDIKCGNILVDVNGQVKLSDFGIAKQVEESLASSLKGTPLYMAPEVLMPDKNTQSCYSYPADIWSLGCTVFELADGKPPWSNLKGFAFFFKVKSKELPPMPEHLSHEGRDFIRSCLQFHPKDRPTASDLLQHPFVSNVAIPEHFCPLSPSSPLSPKLWPPCSQSSSSTWACGHYYPSSPGQQVTHLDHVLGGSQRSQTLFYGRCAENHRDSLCEQQLSC